MEVAISYLKELYRSGYFEKEHSYCDGVWFSNHPACKSSEIWRKIKEYLVKEKYLVIKYPTEENISQLNIHPKDEMDLWWFEITRKGKEVVNN